MSERARVCDSCKVFAIHELRSDDATKEVTTGKSNALSSNGTQMRTSTSVHSPLMDVSKFVEF